MADRIVVMHDGIVEQVGAPLELYDNPKNLFVAGFIGSPAMNMLKGTLRRTGDSIVVEGADGAKLPVIGTSGGTDGQPVVYGIRPEHLELGETDGIPAEVIVVEPTGADTYVYARVAGSQICGVFSERHDFRPGETIHLRPRGGSVHLFDSGTGRHLDA
jgi:multiple sugar transport system ATP-binding protein